MLRLALTIVLTLISGEAIACACSPKEINQAPLPNATIAFVGRPIKIEVMPEPGPPKTIWRSIREWLSPVLGGPEPLQRQVRELEFLDSVHVTFDVTEYVKGKGPKQIAIMTGYGDTDCGLPVSISNEYIIYARQMEGALRTSYCFGSAEYKARPTPLTCKSK